MKRFFGILVLGVLASILWGCGEAATQTTAPTACTGLAITFGDISDDPDEVKADRKPFIDYIGERLSSFGIKCGRHIVVDTVDEMIGLINNGDVDIYMDSLYPATLVSNATEAQPVLRRWRNCDAEYYSVIFTTKNSGITTIDDLPGHMVAMDQIYSTSGFVLPAVNLLDRGLSLAIRDSYESPRENEVGIYFSFDDKNTLNLILEGRVSAGATDDYYFNKFLAEYPDTLVKLAETTLISRQVVLLRPGLSSELQQAIIRELLNAETNPDLNEKKLPGNISILDFDVQTCKYDGPPEVIKAEFNQMQEMHTRIIAIPGWQEAIKSDQ